MGESFARCGRCGNPSAPAESSPRFCDPNLLTVDVDSLERVADELRGGSGWRGVPTSGSSSVAEKLGDAVTLDLLIRVPSLIHQVQVAMNSRHPTIKRGTVWSVDPTCVPAGESTQQKSRYFKGMIRTSDSTNLKPVDILHRFNR